MYCTCTFCPSDAVKHETCDGQRAVRPKCKDSERTSMAQKMCSNKSRMYKEQIKLH